MDNTYSFRNVAKILSLKQCRKFFWRYTYLPNKIEKNVCFVECFIPNAKKELPSLQKVSDWKIALDKRIEIPPFFNELKNSEIKESVLMAKEIIPEYWKTESHIYYFKSFDVLVIHIAIQMLSYK